MTNQVLQCFSEKCLTENSYPVLLTCAMVANSEYDYFAMFSPSQEARCFYVLFISPKYPQYHSHLDLYDTLQSKHRSVHSSPANPDHLTQVSLTSFQKSPVHCAFSPKISVQLHAVQYDPLQSSPFLSIWSSPSSQDKC